MSRLVRNVSCGLVLACAVVGCGSSSPSGSAVGVGSPGQSSAAAPGALPKVDLDAARSRASTDGRVSELSFATSGSRTVKDFVSGNRSTAWVVPVAAGQTATITFQPSARNVFLNVVDVSGSGDVLHNGETQGPNATIKANQDAVLLVEPHLPRADTGQTQRIPYTLTVSRR